MSKKLIIAFSALALAILAGAIAVVGVFAAQQQKVANTFTISYTADNVRATITPAIWYKQAGNSDFDSAFGSHGTSGVHFEPGETEQTKTISPSITLSAQQPAVKLVFVIENDGSVGSRKMSVTLTDTTAVKENVNVYYAMSINPENGPFALTYAELAVEANKTLPETVNLDSYHTVGSLFVFVVIEIADPTLDAKYESTADAGLHLALASVD